MWVVVWVVQWLSVGKYTNRSWLLTGTQHVKQTKAELNPNYLLIVCPRWFPMCLTLELYWSEIWEPVIGCCQLFFFGCCDATTFNNFARELLVALVSCTFLAECLGSKDVTCFLRAFFCFAQSFFQFISHFKIWDWHFKSICKFGRWKILPSCFDLHFFD